MLNPKNIQFSYFLYTELHPHLSKNLNPSTLKSSLIDQLLCRKAGQFGLVVSAKFSFTILLNLVSLEIHWVLLLSIKIHRVRVLTKGSKGKPTLLSTMTPSLSPKVDFICWYVKECDSILHGTKKMSPYLVF